MNKLYQGLLIIFCVGVLLCGIGTGVALTEFSSLAYGGTHVIGETEITKETIDVEFEPSEEPCRTYIYHTYLANVFSGEIQEDESVPENTVRFQVEYNREQVRPEVYWDEEDNAVVFGSVWMQRDEMAAFMEAKDLFFADLKAGKLSSFIVQDFVSVSVLVNPVNAGDVRLTY